MKKLLTLSYLCLCIGIAYAQPTVNLVPFASGFTNGITDIANAGDNRLFVVEQLGYISIVDSTGAVNPTYFLDINNKVTPSTTGNEQGLLGLAFSPDYATDGYFYVNYTDKTGTGNTVIARYRVSSANPNVADTASEEILLYIYQPYSNHNGGDLAFGPDGYLYIALGDGGDAGDPGNRAQDTDSLLGKVLRIDVSDTTGYSIPVSNPFAITGGAPEIWAYGLRNPWRISFDRNNGNFWIADVGQGAWEEVNFQPAGSIGGENYGWRCYEGTHPFDTTGCSTSIGFYTPPVYEYSHAATGGCSVTGGYVYRGLDYPDLTGYYLFSDFCTGAIYSLSPTFAASTAGSFPGNAFTTFGENFTGELYVGSQSNGTVYRIVSTLTSIDTFADGIAQIGLYPNPNQGLFTCELESKYAINSTIEITDLAGRSYYQTDKRLASGFNTFTIDLKDIAAGTYLMKLTTGLGVIYEQFEIVK